MSRELVKQLGLIGLIGMLASCTVGTGPTQALDASPTSTIEAVTTLVSPGTAPSQSGIPSSAPSPTPDVPLYDDGAWLLFQGWDPNVADTNSHLWIVNWDGTGLTDLLPDFFVWQYKIQPSIDSSPGRYVAAITSYGWSDKFMFTLAHLPDGEVVASIPLTNPDTELVNPSDDDPKGEDRLRRASSSMSISDLRSLAWSPDGTQIAFSGAQDGKQTDVYTYSLTDGSVSRLTKGQHPHHASNLLWSPDGQYIAYDDVSVEGLGLGYWAYGIWVVRTNGSTVKQIASMDEWQSTSDWGNRPQKLIWTSDHTLAVYALMTQDFSHYHLKQIDVDTGVSSTITEGEYCGAAFAPEEDVWLVEFIGSHNEQDNSGAYLIRNGTMSKVGPLACCLPVWSPVLDAFATLTGFINVDGTQVVLDLPKSSPLISSDGVYWAYPRGYASLEPEVKRIITTEDVLRIGETGKQPRQISDTPLETLQWSSNNRSILVTDTKEHLQYVAIAPDFSLRLISQYGTGSFIGPWSEGKAIDDKQ